MGLVGMDDSGCGGGRRARACVLRSLHPSLIPFIFPCSLSLRATATCTVTFARRTSPSTARTPSSSRPLGLFMHTCWRVHACARACVCMCVHVHVYVCVCVCASACACVCAVACRVSVDATRSSPPRFILPTIRSARCIDQVMIVNRDDICLDRAPPETVNFLYVHTRMHTCTRAHAHALVLLLLRATSSLCVVAFKTTHLCFLA